MNKQLIGETSFCPVSKTNDFVVQELENELLVYNLKTHQAFCLNETAAQVWQNADGKKSIADIAEALSGIYREKIATDFVWFALNDLAEKNLIKNLPAENKQLIPRRDLIKKIGMGTAVAIPLISGLVAPKAVNASSRCQTQVCTRHADCTINPQQLQDPCDFTTNCCRIEPFG